MQWGEKKKKATLTNSAHLPRNIAEQEKNSSRSLQQQLIKTFDTPHPVDFHGADLVVPYKFKIKHFHQRINFSIKVAIQQVLIFWVKFGKEKYNTYIRIVKGLLEVLEKQGLRCVVCELVFF